MNPNPFSVSALLHRDGSAWVAQGLEYDLAVQAPSREEAKNRFLSALSAHILDDVLDGHAPLSRLSQAPARYFNDLGHVKLSGPELPVYVPAPPKRKKGAKGAKHAQGNLHLLARFLERDAA